MKKKAAIWLFCLIQVVTLCAAPALNADAAQNKAAKKIISVVYDDSGSMWDANDSWAAANYAMQAFAALLNADDEMYITYMSDVQPFVCLCSRVCLRHPTTKLHYSNSAAGRKIMAKPPPEAIDIERVSLAPMVWLRVV
jgi:hypothetical protein